MTTKVRELEIYSKSSRKDLMLSMCHNITLVMPENDVLFLASVWISNQLNSEGVWSSLSISFH